MGPALELAIDRSELKGEELMSHDLGGQHNTTTNNAHCISLDTSKQV
jgi:hypothetical protein